MAPEVGYGDFGAGRAAQIARHAGDAARAVARGAAGDRPAGEVAAGVANAAAAAAKVVADIAGDAARSARALSDESDYDCSGVLARIASNAAEAKDASELVADAARKSVYNAAAGRTDARLDGSGKADAAANAGLGDDLVAKVSEHIDGEVYAASRSTVEDSGSAAAFAARLAYDAFYAVVQAADAAACAARATYDSRAPPVDGPAGDAAAAATAIADAVDPFTARARAHRPTLTEMISRMTTLDRRPAVAEVASTAAHTSSLVSTSVRRARAFAARMEADCRAAIDLCDRQVP